MITITGVCNTITAGDVYEAARCVGGNANISKCDINENCSIVARIPRNRIIDFCVILDERADM